ncbi:hypothetical protein B9Z55_013446 [Caenorhabditis nigoni]|uniref:G-protein coupled receptors family 1 profile domain-containing protein n=2 Tax=Caenorhabditis nigoni TaxID=1611254 RepID=A0A2G5U1R6_9PELO|nr:hypothetical protein B9Z55_013446 [Caenorhabditis nigoni]
MVSIKGHFNWTHAVYFGLFVVIMPIYFLILVCLLKLRKSENAFKTTFYSLLLQHSIADVVAMGLYAFQKVSYVLIPDLIFGKQEFLAPFFYNCFFWFIIIRSSGVALLTIHRYLVIVKSFFSLSISIQKLKSWKIILMYWIPAMVFDSVFYSDPTVQFDSVENLKNIVNPETTLRSTIVCISFLSISCFICAISNCLIIKYVRAKSSSFSKPLQRELRLTLQVSLPFGAQLVLLCFMIFANLYAKTGNVSLSSHLAVSFN